jgi:hypothetical protein
VIPRVGSNADDYVWFRTQPNTGAAAVTAPLLGLLARSFTARAWRWRYTAYAHTPPHPPWQQPAAALPLASLPGAETAVRHERDGCLPHSYPLLRGQNRIVRTIAQTMPQPIQVMFGWAACHSRICLWMAISAMSVFGKRKMSEPLQSAAARSNSRARSLNIRTACTGTHSSSPRRRA